MPDGLDFSNQAEPLDFSDQAVAAPSRQFATPEVMAGVRMVEGGDKLGLTQEHRPGTPDSARGPYGIKPSTAERPGYGVAPLQDWNNSDEHDRFAADYLEALSVKHGSLEGGLAAYNADTKGVYAPKVMASVKKLALDFSAQAEPLDFSAQAVAPTKDTSKPATARNQGLGQQVTYGATRGWHNLTGTGAALAAWAGDVAGADTLRDWGLAAHKEAEEKAKQYPASVGTYENVEGIGDAGRLAIDYFAENLPMLLPAIFTGGFGAIAARTVAQRVVASKVAALTAEMAAKGTAKDVAQAAAEKAVAQQLAKTTVRGGMAGAGAAAVGQETGSIYGDIFTETGEYRPGVAVLFGTGAGALDVLPQMRLIGKFFPVGGKEIVEGLVKRVGKGAATQLLLEGGTEGLQTVIEKAAVEYVDPEKKTFSKKNIPQIINSILAGATMGAGMGAVAGIPGGGKPSPKPSGKATPDEAPPLSSEAAAQVPPAQTHIGFSPGNDEDGNPLPQDDASVVGLQPNGTVRIVFTHTGQTRDIDAAEFLEAEKRLPTEAERATNLAAAGMPGDKREQTASVAQVDRPGENQIGGLGDPSQSLGDVFYDLPASILDDLNFGLRQNGTAEQQKKEADKLRQIKLDFLRDADSVNRTLQSAIKQQADAKANENHGQAALLQGSISDLKRKGAAASLPIPKRGATDQELADWYTNKLELAQFENDPNGERLEAFMRGMSPEKKADFARWAIWGKEMANPEGATIPVPDRGKRVPQGSVGVPGIPSHLRDVNAALKMEAPAPGTVVTREQAAAFNLMRTALNQYRDQNPDRAPVPVPEPGEGVPAAAVGEPGRRQLPNVQGPTVWPEIRHGDAATPAQVAAWARLKTELGQYQGNPEGVSPTPIPPRPGAGLGELGNFQGNPDGKEPILPPRKPQTVKDIQNEVADDAQRLNKENKAFRLAPATKKGERRFLAAPENIAQAVNRLGGWADPIRGKYDRSKGGQMDADRALQNNPELNELVAAGKSRGHTYLKLEGQELKRLSEQLIQNGFPPPGSSLWQAEGNKKQSGDDGGREANTTEWTQDELVSAITEGTLRSTRDREIAAAYEEQNRRLNSAEAEAQNNADEYAAAMAAWERGGKPQEEGIIPPVDGGVLPNLMEMGDAAADALVDRVIGKNGAEGAAALEQAGDAGITDETAINEASYYADDQSRFDFIPVGTEERWDAARAGEADRDAKGVGEPKSKPGGKGPVAESDPAAKVNQPGAGPVVSEAPPLDLTPTDAAAKRPAPKQLGLTGKGFVSRDENAKMKPETGQKVADEGLFTPPKDKRQTDIEDNSGEPGAEARQEAPGEPMTVYRGSGRSTQSEVYNENSAAVPIFGGDGKYYAFDQEHAKYYGPNVETATIQPRNPFYIRSDDQWRALTKRAGWRVPNPFGQSESEVKLGVERLMKEIGAGHDAVMVTWDDSTASDTDKNGNSIKTLRDVFGVPQVFIPEPPKKSPRAASKFQRTEGSTKQQRTDAADQASDNEAYDDPDGERFHIAHDAYGINYPGNEAKRQEAVKIVREAIERVVGPVQIKVFDRLMGADDSGKFTPTSGLFERVGNVIMAALESSNLTHTGRHEVIHFLMQNDMLPPHMRRAMEGMADQWVKLYEIKKHYPDLDAAGQREEAIAEAFAHWNDKPETFKDSVKQAFQAIKDIFNSIANAFRDKGVYTYRDAFRAIDRGDMKGRIEGVNDYTAHPTGDGRFALKDQRDGGVLRIYDTRKEAVDAAHGLEATEIAGRAMERQIQSGIINPIVAQVARGGAAAERKFVATARQALPVNEVGAVNFPDSTNAVGLKSLSKIGLWITFPRAMATWDRLGAAVYRAYDNIGKESHRLQSKYATMMAPYTQLTAKQRTRVNAALEIARLTKSNIRDGKGTLIVTNDNLKHAVHSEVGDSFRLTDKEKAAFHSVQNMHRQQWSDRLVGVAREFGYDGRSTNPAEIMKYFSDKIKEEQANGQSKDSTKKAGAQGRKEFAEAGYDVIQGFDAQRRNGYTPLRRYGDERVDVRLKETGELVYTTFMNEGKGDTLVVGEHFAEGHKPKSPQQLTTMEKLRAQYPSNAYEVTAREVGDIPKMPSNLRAILGALKNAGGKGSNLDAITVKKEVQQIREYYKSEMMRHAQDYPGYSADFERAIADNLMSMANGTARATYRAQYENAMWDIDNHTNANLASYRNNKKFWKDYDTYMQDKDSGEFSAARQLSFLYFLSAAGSAIINLTQTPMVAVPNIGQWGGGRGASNFLRAIPSAVLGFRANLKNGVEYNSESLGKNSQERELLRDLGARGVLSAQNVRDMQGLNTVKNPDLRPLGNQVQKVIDIMTSMFSASETANRALTALIAYRTALAPGAIAKADSVYKNNQLYQRMRAENDGIMTPQLLAEYTVEESQGVSGPQNRMKVARGAGAWLTQFKLYPWQMLENMTRIARQNGVEGKIAAAVMIAALVATAGLGGIPFAEDMVELANWAVNLVAGRDVGLDLQAKEWMKEFFGQTGADIILNGASKSQLGISLERRFGMGNMIPGAQVSEWLGMPYAMTVGLATNIYQRWESGQPLGTIAATMPALLRSIFESLVVIPNEGIQPVRGKHLTVAPNEFTLGAQLARILGFKSALEVKRVGDFWDNERQKSAVTEFTRSRYENIGKPLYWSVYWAQQGDKGMAAEFERQFEAAVAADAKENGALPLMWQQKLTPAQFKAKILGFLDPELAQFMRTPKHLQAQLAEEGKPPPTPRTPKQ